MRNDGGALGAINTGGVNPLLDGEWHHVVATFTAADETASLCIDGEEAASGASAFFSSVDEVNTAGIGRNKDTTAGGGQWFFDGTMDDFGLWNRPLSSAEVAFIYDNGLKGQPLFGGGGSGLQITDVQFSAEPRQLTITWNSRPGRTYGVEFSTELSSWEELEDGIEAADGETTTFTDTFAVIGKTSGYFRVSEGN